MNRDNDKCVSQESLSGDSCGRGWRLFVKICVIVGNAILPLNPPPKGDFFVLGIFNV